MVKKILNLLAGTSTGKIIQFVYFFSLVDLLGKQEFGQYAVSMTLFLIVLYPLVEFGTELLISREVAKDNIGFYFSVLYWKILSFPLFGFIVSLGAYFYFDLPVSITILSAILVWLRSIENGNAALFRGKNLANIESLHLVFSRGVSILLLALIVVFQKRLLNVETAIILQIIGVVISFAIVEVRHIVPDEIPRFSWSKTKKILTEGLPLALNAVCWLIYYKIDILLISKILGVGEAGSYEIAYKIMEATFILPMVVMAVVYRGLVRAETLQEFRNIVKKYSTILGIAGLGVAVGSALMFPFVFSLFFPADQNSSIRIFRILVIAIPFIYVAHLSTQVLVVKDKKYSYLRITLFGAVLNFGLNIPLIHFIGTEGAAIATVITEAYILIASAIIVFVSSKPGKQEYCDAQSYPPYPNH